MLNRIKILATQKRKVGLNMIICTSDPFFGWPSRAQRANT